MQGGPDHPKVNLKLMENNNFNNFYVFNQAPLGNNFRPPQPLLHRAVRTNIDFRSKQPNAKSCPTMYKEVHYKGRKADKKLRYK
jgi:hypothetical protein